MQQKETLPANSWNSKASDNRSITYFFIRSYKNYFCWRYPRGTVASSLEISNVRRLVRDERAVNSILMLRRSCFDAPLNEF